MTYQEYLNQEDPQPLKIGAVIVKESELHSLTTEAGVTFASFMFKDEKLTYIVDHSRLLWTIRKNGRRDVKTVFRLEPIIEYCENDSNKVKTVNGKLPIVNGHVNPTLTLEEALLFDWGEGLSNLTHCLRVDLTYVHNYEYPTKQEWIDEAVELYGKSLSLDVPYEEYYSDPLRYFPMFWKAKEVISAHTKVRRSDFDFKLGKKIHASIQELSYNACFDLRCNQLVGFVKAIGNWNNFNAGKVMQAIRATEEITPRMYGSINNCNNGRKMHQWQVYKDYIFLKSGYCTGDVLDTWKAFEEDLRVIWGGCAVDSFSYEIDTMQLTKDHPVKECGITYAFWWD